MAENGNGQNWDSFESSSDFDFEAAAAGMGNPLEYAAPEDEFDLTEEDELNQTAEQVLDIKPEDIDEERSTVTVVTGGNMRPVLLQEDEEQLREAGVGVQNEEIISEAGIITERTETEQEIEKRERSNKMVIDTCELVKEAIEEGVNTELATSLNAEKVREYKNHTQYYKGKFGKAQESGDNPMKKLCIMAVACVACGIFGGVYTNSNYILSESKMNNMISCSFSWITKFDSMPVRISPFYADAFFTGMMCWAGLLALIFLFSWLNSSMMKNSRVGHEHGNAKLMDNSSFKKYKNRFMEG